MVEKQGQMSEDDFREIVEAFLVNGATLKDLRNLTEKDMEAIYSVGYSFYNAGKYDEAHDMFKFLCFYDHLERRWWMGLAATRQMLKDFQGAVEAYRYAAMLDVEDPTPHLHAADCFLSLKEYENADSALNAVIHWADDKAEHSDKKKRAEFLLKALEEQKKGGTGS